MTTIRKMIEETGTDISGKWVSVDKLNVLSDRIVDEVINWISDNVGMITPEERSDLREFFDLKK